MRIIALPMLLLAVSAPLPLRAQLLSPGHLIAAHRDLEGVRHCTQCHQLGERGVANAKCLDCHELLRDRIARRVGYHATVAPQGCGDCHKDHFGATFAAIRLDTAGYDHAGEVGFPLTGAHARLSCRECHRADAVKDTAVRGELGPRGRLDATFLGLGTTCLACHRADDPHAGQFGRRACDECHGDADWKRPDRFDHAATRYPLTGGHRNVTCRSCHPPLPGRRGALRLSGVAFAACADCHRDPHAGAMGARCESCHVTGGWRQLDRPAFERRFDHARTRFQLAGAHARAACAACHEPARVRAPGLAIRHSGKAGAYPIPDATRCGSCHVDAHRGGLRRAPGGGECRSCHGEDTWLPSSFDLARHDRDTDYPLTGAHRAAPCLACHRRAGGPAGADGLRFGIADRSCLACHGDADPHAGQFPGRACDDCHDTASFRIARFDHTRTRYPLDGAHRRVPCAACHPLVAEGGRQVRRYRPVGTACRDCHGERQ